MHHLLRSKIRAAHLHLPAAVSLALGVWATGGRLDLALVDGRVVRVAMLPSWWWLIGLCALGVGAARAARRSARVSDAAWPLAAAGLMALPYLPWLPDAFPVLRALAGSAKWIVWGVVVGLAVWGTAGGRRLVPDRRPIAAKPALRPALAVVLAGAAAFGFAASRLAGTPLFPGGDEPHYLIITQSILRDGDLKIENNHARGDYAAYFPQRLEPHYLTRGVDGAIYSVHPVGLPVVIAPAFALAGYRGVVIFLVLAGAVAAAASWAAAFRLTGSMAAATFGWAAMALTAPFLFNTFTVYPEVVAAGCVMAAFSLISGPAAGSTGSERSASGGRWLTAGVAAAALPWLSTKYAPMAAVLVSLAVWRAIEPPGNGRWGRVLIVVVPFGLSLAAWFGFFLAFWGTPSPRAPYGGYDQTALAHLRVGAPGLWFDQEYGLLAYAPVLALAGPGLWNLWRDGHRRQAFAIAVIFGALWATSGAFRIWWGGSAAPGRPVVAALPLLGIPIAWQFRRAAGCLARRAGHLALLAASLGLAAALLLSHDGLALATERDGTARFLEWLSVSGELPRLFPSYIAHHPLVASAHAGLWVLAALVTGWFVARPAGSRTDDRGRAALRALTTGLVVFVGVTGVMPLAFGVRLQPLPPLEARTRAGLLDAFDASRRPVAIRFDPLRLVDPQSIPPLLSLVARADLASERPRPAVAGIPWNARLTAPAGRYAVEVRPSARSAVGPRGQLDLRLAMTGPPFRSWWIEPGRAHRFEVDVPIDAGFLWFAAAADVLSSISEIKLAPIRIVDRHRRPVMRPALSSALYSAASGRPVVVFFHDDGVFPEAAGFWIRGRASASVTIAPAVNGPIRLRLHTGPVANEVRLSAPGRRQTLAFAPDSARQIELAPSGDTGVVPVTLAVRSGFVPADRDPRSTDRRQLGCWIEIVQ